MGSELFFSYYLSYYWHSLHSIMRTTILHSFSWHSTIFQPKHPPCHQNEPSPRALGPILDAAIGSHLNWWKNYRCSSLCLSGLGLISREAGSVMRRIWSWKMSASMHRLKYSLGTTGLEVWIGLIQTGLSRHHAEAAMITGFQILMAEISCH